MDVLRSISGDVIQMGFSDYFPVTLNCELKWAWWG